MKQTHFGNPAKALQYMAIRDHLATVHSGDQNILAFCIANAIYGKIPIVKICSFILGVAKEAEDTVIDIIGIDCLTKIKNLHGK